MSYSRKTNILRYEYQLCHTAIARTSSIKDLDVFFDSKLHFHNNVDFIFSECIKLLGIIRSITLRWQAEAICSCETSVAAQQTTRRHIPEDDTLHNHRWGNLKF
jgi:hypothetical protein